MKLKLKIVWICFYLFTLLILILNGDFKIKRLRNFWKEFLNTIKKPARSDEDNDWITIHKNDKK